MSAGISGRWSMLACGIGVAVCVACQGDRGTTPSGIGTIVAVAGDDQEGVVGAVLDAAVTVRVLDSRGDPVRGARITWAVQDSGSVDPRTSTTDNAGGATTHWRLGPGEHPQHLVAFAEGYVPATFRAVANPHPLGIDVARPLVLETYEGSGQTVHPDYLTGLPSTIARGDLLALTPYPFGNSAYENPAVYTSNDLLRWSVPFPALNPVVSPQRGYLSDPDLVYDPARREVLLYYRQVERENEILLVRSRDGVHWGDPKVVAHAPNHEIVSPAIVRRADDAWLMWSVNGKGGCVGAETTVELRRSTNGEQWSAPETVQLAQPGFTAWHIEVQWIATRGEYWAVYNGKTVESCATPALFFATSTDGVHWKTYPSPVLARGEIPALNDIVYRSSFDYDPATDVVTFFFSGARYNGAEYVWSSVVQRRRRADAFDRVTAATPRAMMALRAASPPLLDPP